MMVTPCRLGRPTRWRESACQHIWRETRRGADVSHPAAPPPRAPRADPPLVPRQPRKRRGSSQGPSPARLAQLQAARAEGKRRRLEESAGLAAAGAAVPTGGGGPRHSARVAARDAASAEAAEHEARRAGARETRRAARAATRAAALAAPRLTAEEYMAGLQRRQGEGVHGREARAALHVYYSFVYDKEAGVKGVHPAQEASRRTGIDPKTILELRNKYEASAPMLTVPPLEYHAPRGRPNSTLTDAQLEGLKSWAKEQKEVRYIPRG